MNPSSGNRGFIRCTNCGYPQQGESYNSMGFSVCPHCNSRLRISIFPALFAENKAGGEIHSSVSEKAATCFYHSTRTAVIPCGSCGRYLCTLCEIELGGKTICPDCMEKAARNEEMTELIESRTLYDSIALSIAVYPLLLWFITFVTAPISIYMTIHHWRTPQSILPRSRFRFVAAFILAGIQISLWSVFLFKILT